MATTQFSPQMAAAPPGVSLPPSNGNGTASLAAHAAGGSNGTPLQGPESLAEQSGLVPRSVGHAVGEAVEEQDAFLQLSPAFARMPVGVVVSVPVREFRVRHLLAMAPGAVIETQWGYGEDLPLSSGSVQLAWSEFEVVDTKLAVRVTRLA